MQDACSVASALTEAMVMLGFLWHETDALLAGLWEIYGID